MNQPEWREIFKPESKPTLVVLVDASRSMQTRDVVDRRPFRTRAPGPILAKPFADPAAWREVAKKMDVAVERFSSGQQPPDEGTDINAALIQAIEKHPRLSAVVLVSDGDWNSGDPPSEAAMRLRMRDVPVFAVPLGSETRLPDVELLGFDVPTFADRGQAAAHPVHHRELHAAG